MKIKKQNTGTKIYLACCYPFQVKEVNKEVLELLEVEVLNDWNVPTISNIVELNNKCFLSLKAKA